MNDDKCPVCESEFIEGDMIDTPGDNTASQREFCQKCNAEWVNMYTLVDQHVDV